MSKSKQQQKPRGQPARSRPAGAGAGTKHGAAKKGKRTMGGKGGGAALQDVPLVGSARPAGAESDEGEEDLQLSDEDHEFVEQHRKRLRFLETLDQKELDRSIREKQERQVKEAADARRRAGEEGAEGSSGGEGDEGEKPRGVEGVTITDDMEGALVETKRKAAEEEASRAKEQRRKAAATAKKTEESSLPPALRGLNLAALDPAARRSKLQEVMAAAAQRLLSSPEGEALGELRTLQALVADEDSMGLFASTSGGTEAAAAALRRLFVESRRFHLNRQLRREKDLAVERLKRFHIHVQQRQVAGAAAPAWTPKPPPAAAAAAPKAKAAAQRGPAVVEAGANGQGSGGAAPAKVGSGAKAAQAARGQAPKQKPAGRPEKRAGEAQPVATGGGGGGGVAAAGKRRR
ncbi:hypothetical protein TSOC_006549 [Tetrabaena socialis]|uniref:Uncharacterized protein n=1 Tax=Tetrabaena socialis TaxID=47790 RepID=A0A2J8A3E3_9CHLO|nr:hypothetical protein TSOC_006549 [Tetrabaena socialis]|eukprot:PNH07047.1 hypothetical protein TSOC_006549 [Tetrabaena socialis]